MNRWLGIAIVAVCAAAAAVTMGVLNKQPQAQVLRLGYFPNITHTQALIGASRGDFQNAIGSGVRLDAKTFNAGPEEMEALFAGQIDIGYIGPTPAVNGYIKSQGRALRIVAGATSGGASLVVRADSGISRPSDLVGRRIASPQLGNTQDVALRHYLETVLNAKLAEKGGDTRVIPIRNPDILTLLKKGDLDAAWVPEPWAARLVAEANGRILIDERTLWPNKAFTTAVVIVRKKYLDEHPELVSKFLAAHVDVTKWVQAHPKPAQQLVNAELKRITGKTLPPEVLTQAYSRMSVVWDPLEPTIKEYARWTYELGFLGKTQPDLTRLCDVSYLGRATGQRNVAQADRTH